jgi:diaminopimelate epimerase
MICAFHKYQGTGNDFVMIDNRDELVDRKDAVLFAAICHRRFGIGADGVILLQHAKGYDFEMVYANADGKESTMCGNGGRCILRFAHALGIHKDKYHFLAVDGPHEGWVDGETVHLKMGDVTEMQHVDKAWVLHTGSPHYVVFSEGVASLAVREEGRTIRNSTAYQKEGINVNFAEILDKGLFIRTFERGVEDETYSCGTGVTACAIAWSVEKNMPPGSIRQQVRTPGGHLSVSFEKISNQHFTEVWLSGPAESVFTGLLNTTEIIDKYSTYS